MSAANNGSDQLAALELNRVLDAIRNKYGLDPREVYRTPDKNKGEETKQISYRVANGIYEEVEALVKRSERYRNITDFGRQYCVIGLMIEAEIEGRRPSPIILEAMKQARERELASLDRQIRSARDDLEAADGEKAREEERIRLNALLDHCKEWGYEERTERLRRALGNVAPYGID